MNEDIEEMMYGFGDEWPPNPETTALMEALVKEYIEDLASRALEIAQITGRLDRECFQFLCRKDSRKFNRVKKLIEANEELKTVQNVPLTDDPTMLEASELLKK